MRLQHARGVLTLDAPVVMGVLNVTPDSFSDGGRYLDPDLALDHALRLRDEGATFIDVGGESTRPGAATLDEAAELARVLPVVRRLARASDVLVSVDTSSALVAEACLEAGAALINDIRAGQRAGLLEAVAGRGAAVCLMHMQGEPASMQAAPVYDDVVSEVRDFLHARLQACERAGISREQVLFDPGFGFGKSPAHNLQLLAALPRLAEAGVPLLVGLSRKSLLQTLTGRGVHERLAGSVALATLAVRAGARVVRAHDVAATLDAVKVAWALRQAEESGGVSG
jgi:dihydropteroate synthase